MKKEGLSAKKLLQANKVTRLNLSASQNQENEQLNN
jgi:hypothetical protein